MRIPDQGQDVAMAETHTFKNESLYVEKLCREKARHNICPEQEKGTQSLLYTQGVGPNHRSHSHPAKWHKNVTAAGMFYAIRNGS